MTPQRKEHLYRQYVIPIVNDGTWYRVAKRQIDDGDVENFYNRTHSFITSLASALDEDRPEREERAYIYLHTWIYHGGTAESFLTNTRPAGALRDYVQRLIRESCTQQPEPQKEEPVNGTNSSVAFETRHYVFGMDVANMNSGQLIDAIKRIEAEINDLKSVKAKSEHVKKRIAELEGMLAKVVEVLDAK